MTKLYLPVPEEFTYERNYEFLQRSPKELLHRLENGAVIKLLKIGEEKVLFSVKPGNQKLILEFLNGDPSDAAKDFTRQFVREWFDLENDIKPFYAMASKDKLLKDLIKKYYGYRIMGQPD